MSAEQAICSMPDCAKPPRHGQRYCSKCHGLYMKAWRAKRRREELRLRDSVVKLRQQVVTQKRELEELKASS